MATTHQTQREVTVLYMKPAYAGSNSYDVFERGRLNDFGEPFCVAPQVTYEQAVAMTVPEWTWDGENGPHGDA